MKIEERIKRLERYVFSMSDKPRCESCNSTPKNLDELDYMDQTDQCFECSEAGYDEIKNNHGE